MFKSFDKIQKLFQSLGQSTSLMQSIIMESEAKDSGDADDTEQQNVSEEEQILSACKKPFLEFCNRKLRGINICFDSGSP